MSTRSKFITDKVISSLSDERRSCIKTLLDDKQEDMARNLLKSYAKNYALTKPEANEILNIIHKPNIPKNKKDPPMKKLNEKANKILIKNNKLKNSSAFKIRPKMGPLAIYQNNIGNDINELSLQHLTEDITNSLTRDWATLHFKTIQIFDDIKKEDEKLMKFDLKSFVKTIDDNNKSKKLLSKKTRKKNRVIMKDNNHKATKPPKQKRVYNDKSHLMRCKYSQFMDFEQFLGTKINDLNKLKNDLKEVAMAFGIIDANNQCFQANRWIGPFDNDTTVDFMGKNAFNRYKKDIKAMNDVEKEINIRLNKLNVFMLQSTWKRVGKCRGTKTFRERVSDYNAKKDKLREKRKKKQNNNKKNENNNKTDTDNKQNDTNTNNKKKNGNICQFFKPNIGDKRSLNAANNNIINTDNKRIRINNNLNRNEDNDIVL